VGGTLDLIGALARYLLQRARDQAAR